MEPKRLLPCSQKPTDVSSLHRHNLPINSNLGLILLFYHLHIRFANGSFVQTFRLEFIMLILYFLHQGNNVWEFLAVTSIWMKERK